MLKKIHFTWIGVCVRIKYSLLENPFFVSLVALGVLFLLTKPNAAHAFNGEKYKDVCGGILGMFEGGFGALLTACAGIGAICASAMGGFKMAWGLIVVSVGSFILGEYQKLFFDPC